MSVDCSRLSVVCAFVRVDVPVGPIKFASFVNPLHRSIVSCRMHCDQPSRSPSIPSVFQPREMNDWNRAFKGTCLYLQSKLDVFPLPSHVYRRVDIGVGPGLLICKYQTGQKWPLPHYVGEP